MIVMDDPASPHRPSVVTTCRELVALLRTQHEELRTLLTRVPRLEGAAREDVFLQVRRRLAVHEALERFLVTPRLAATSEELPDVHDEVRAVERADVGSREFEVAHARLSAAHRRHCQVQENEVFARLGGSLTESEQAVATAAVRLWSGEGERYLGHSYPAMVAVADEELGAAAGSWPR